MPPPRPLGVRILRLLGLTFLGLVALLAIVLWLPFTRQLLVVRGLPILNANLEGYQVTGARLERLSPWGVTLRDVIVRTPRGELARVGLLAVELAPSALLHEVVDLSRVQLANTRVHLDALPESDAPKEEPDSAPSTWIVRARALEVRDLTLDARLQERSLHATITALRARGEWSDTPQVQVDALALEVRSEAGRLLRLGPVQAKFHAKQGGEVKLEGALAAAPIALQATLPGLHHAGPWPLHALSLTLSGLDRQSLATLGMPEGAELRAPLDLSVRARAQADQLTAHADLRTGAAHLALKANADTRTYRLTLELEPTQLASLSGKAPVLALGARLALEAEAQGFPGRMQLTWTDVSVDAEKIPDGSLALHVALPVVRVEQLAIAGFERSISLRGAYDTASGDAHVKLDVSQLRLEKLAPLRAQQLSGVLHGGLDFTLEGGRLGGAAALQLSRLAHPSAQVAELALGLKLAGSLAHPEGSFDLRVRDARAPNVYLARLDAEARATKTQITAKLLAQGERLQLAAELTGTRKPDGSARLNAHGQGQVYGKQVRLSLRELALSSSGYALEEGLLRAGAQELRLSGSLNANQRAQVALALTRVDLGQWAELAGVDALSGQLDANIQVDGPLRFPQLRGAVQLREVHYQEHPALNARLELAAEPRTSQATATLRVSSELLDAQLDAAMTLPKRVRDWVAGAELGTYGIELQARGPVAPLAKLAGVPLEGVVGNFETRLGVEGTLDAPEAQAEVLAQLGLASAPAKLPDSVRLSATITPEAGRLGLTLRDAQGAWLALESGAAWPSAGLRALAGPQGWRRLRAEARTRLAPRELDQLDGVFGALLRLYAPALPVAAALDLRARSDEGALSGVLQLALSLRDQALDGQCAPDARTHVDLQASLAGEQLALQVTASGARTGTLQAQVGSPLVIGENTASLVRFGPATLALEGTDLALAELPGACKLSTGQAQLRLRAENLGAGVPITELELDVRDLVYQESPPLALHARAQSDPRSARLTSDIAVGSRNAAHLTATLPLREASQHVPALDLDRPLSARLQVQKLPLDTVLSLTSALGTPSGTLDADLSLSGSAKAPHPRGHVEVHDAAFSIASLAQPFRDVHARVELDGRTLELVHASARDRSGELALKGRAQLFASGAGEATFALEAKRFPLRQQGIVVGELSTRAQVKAELDTAQMTDLHARILEGRIWLTGEDGADVQGLEPHPHVRFAEDLDAPADMPDSAEAQYALRAFTLESQRDLWLQHEDFAVQVGVQLTVLNQAAGPKLRGEASLRRGDLALLGKPFRLERGAVRFTGDIPPDPELDIRAVHQPPSGLPLQVHVGGRASAPLITFSGAANNAGEAMALLSGVGRTSSGAQSQAQNDAAAFAAGITAGLLSVAARRQFGDWVPMISIENDRSGAPGRARAGFDASNLIPSWMQGFARSAYVEGIVGSSAGAPQKGAGVGVRLELALPRDFITSMGYGPGSTWSTDVTWSP